MIISILNNPRGPNSRQLFSFNEIVKGYSLESEFRIGGDRQDVKLLESLRNYVAVIYPLIGNQSDFSEFRGYKIEKPENISNRNRHLVDSADIIIAIPMMVFEYEDSAVWRTINYAIGKGKDLIILSPKGNVYIASNKIDIIEEFQE